MGGALDCLALLLDGYGRDIEERNGSNKTPIYVAALGKLERPNNKLTDLYSVPAGDCEVPHTERGPAERQGQGGQRDQCHQPECAPGHGGV